MFKENKIKFLLIIFLITISIIGYLTLDGLSSKQKIELYDKEYFTGIGKSYTIIIEEDDIGDYTIMDTDDFKIWDENERAKFKKYMKDNNLKLKVGTYDMHQTYTLKKAIEVLKFENITN